MREPIYSWGDCVVYSKIYCSEFEQTGTIKEISKAIDIVQDCVHYRDTGGMHKVADEDASDSEIDEILESGEFDPIVPKDSRMRKNFNPQQVFKTTYHILKSYINQ